MEQPFFGERKKVFSRRSLGYVCGFLLCVLALLLFRSEDSDPTVDTGSSGRQAAAISEPESETPSKAPVPVNEAVESPRFTSIKKQLALKTGELGFSNSADSGEGSTLSDTDPPVFQPGNVQLAGPFNGVSPRAFVSAQQSLVEHQLQLIAEVHKTNDEQAGTLQELLAELLRAKFAGDPYPPEYENQKIADIIGEAAAADLARRKDQMRSVEISERIERRLDLFEGIVPLSDEQQKLVKALFEQSEQARLAAGNEDSAAEHAQRKAELEGALKQALSDEQFARYLDSKPKMRRKGGINPFGAS